MAGRRAGKASREEASHEQGTSAGGDEEGCVCAELRWRAQRLGSERAVFCRMGNVPREGIAGGSEPDLCVAVERVVWAGSAAVGRRRKNVGSGGKQVCV